MSNICKPPPPARESDSVMDSTEINAAEKLRALQSHYLTHLSETLDELDKLRAATLAGLVDTGTQTALRALAHQIAGGASLYGYPSITDAAKDLERLLDDLPGGPCKDVTRKADALYNACKNAIKSGPALDAATAATDAAQEENMDLPLVAAIDDDPMLRLIYKTLLKDVARLSIGSTTNDALRIMKTEKPALVLMDDIMPGGQTGLSFLENIKQDPELSRIPVIMVTASDRKEDILRGLAAGAIDYIIKPFLPDSLLRAVKTGLARKEHRVILCLHDHALSDALAERLGTLNCRIEDLDRARTSLIERLSGEPCIVVMDHLPATEETLRVMSQQYQQSYYIGIGVECEALDLHLPQARFAHAPHAPKAEDILYLMGHMLAEIKKGKD